MHHLKIFISAFGDYFDAWLVAYRTKFHVYDAYVVYLMLDYNRNLQSVHQDVVFYSWAFLENQLLS